MAELTFVGAAGTVTGSKHLVSIGETRFFVDCGLFQGAREVEALNHVPLPIHPKLVDAVVVTHGHLDHVGYLPKLVRDGFRGPIYCTPPTADVIEIVLEDAAHLQHHMHERGFRHERSHGLAPFFDQSDVKNALGLLRTIPYEKEFSVCGASVRYRAVGHIIGAAYVDMAIENRRVIFSGDVGRYGSALLNDPTPLDTADVVVCEATYGDREHPPDPLEALHATLLDGIRRGGPIVIPTFAVERAQDLLYALGRLQSEDAAIAQLPVHLDSPMAIKIDAIFARHRDAYKALPEVAGGTFGCRNFSMHVSSDESKRLNSINAPAIIIASSGMATGGRILYHLHRNIPNPAATIVFPGFQVPGTLGRLLIDGVSPVRIFGDKLNVKANIVHLTAYSAHADQSELLRWLGTLKSKGARIYLVHTEPRVASVFAAVLKERLGLTATPAERGMTVKL
jgi:metallo-beta-lactamase family protein